MLFELMNDEQLLILADSQAFNWNRGDGFHGDDRLAVRNKEK